MDDKKYTKLIFIALAFLLLWWLAQRRKLMTSAGENVTLPNGGLSPEQEAYANNPGAFGPSTLNINISNQGLGYLDNQYMPLFGFVGMAQGVYYG